MRLPQQIFAEVKTLSPFGWKSDLNWDELFAIAAEIGDCISIHTDLRWGGSFDLLHRARSMTTKPILAKGIHDHDDLIRRAIDLGADFALCVGRIPGIHREKCLLEPYNLDGLRQFDDCDKVVWNTRDLISGRSKTETFVQARAAFKGWLCQASNIKVVADVEPYANAVLIGTNLMEFAGSIQ